MASLPTFEDMRRSAYALLGDAADELRSDWEPGTGPNREQAEALALAKAAIAQAKAHLNEASSN
jgi:hypothetical protein